MFDANLAKMFVANLGECPVPIGRLTAPRRSRVSWDRLGLPLCGPVPIHIYIYILECARRYTPAIQDEPTL